jgi:hypothetical protein
MRNMLLSRYTLHSIPFRVNAAAKDTRLFLALVAKPTIRLI